MCSLVQDDDLAIICPVRFIESQRIFVDVGRLAFGPGARVAPAPEVRVLRTTQTARGRPATGKRIGKVDFLVARVEENGAAVDFAALEVQAVYISGPTIKPVFKHFLNTGSLPSGGKRRPDWRSSAQKRLMPQLALKVPVFRRWGKKFFVAVDSCFFAELPNMRTVDNIANSEITWLVYRFQRSGNKYTIGDPDVVHTTWDDVVTALREGVAPDPDEILSEIERKLRSGNVPWLPT